MEKVLVMEHFVYKRSHGIMIQIWFVVAISNNNLIKINVAAVLWKLQMILVNKDMMMSVA